MPKTISIWIGTALLASIAPFLLVTALTTGLVFFTGGAFAHEPVDQPLAFNHEKHLEALDEDCAACHSGCREGVNSGLPNTKACALCHSSPQGESAAEKQFIAMLEAGAQLEWRSLFQQPAHVFFSHRRHTTVAGLECDECHGDIGKSTAPPKYRAALRMDRCIGCHETSRAPTDCSACHR